MVRRITGTAIGVFIGLAAWALVVQVSNERERRAQVEHAERLLEEQRAQESAREAEQHRAQVAEWDARSKALAGIDMEMLRARIQRDCKDKCACRVEDDDALVCRWPSDPNRVETYHSEEEYEQHRRETANASARRH